jgi:hypothetical protein
VDTTAADGTPTLEQFLASLRTAWQYGEVRPTLYGATIWMRERGDQDEKL